MKRFLLCSVAAAGLALASPAYADPVDWNFGDHLGNLGTTQTFTSNGPGLNLTARGFTATDTGEGLFGKSAGSGETGLGLQNDPSHEGEITGNNFVQLNLDGIRGQLSGFQFSMNSTTAGETWAVYGSEDSSPFTFVLLASGNDQDVLHSLAGGYDNYNFFSTEVGGNVLLGSFDAVAAVPEPSTWALMLLGFVGITFMGMRKRSHHFA